MATNVLPMRRRQGISKKRFVPYNRECKNTSWQCTSSRSHTFQEFLHHFSMEHFSGEPLVPLDEIAEKHMITHLKRLNSQKNDTEVREDELDKVDGIDNHDKGHKESIKNILKGVLSTIFFYPRDHPNKLVKILDNISLGPEDKVLTKREIFDLVQQKGEKLTFMTPLFKYLHRILKQNFKGKDFELYLNLFSKLCKLVSMFIRSL